MPAFSGMNPACNPEREASTLPEILHLLEKCNHYPNMLEAINAHL
ncbi:hypothetical protein V2O64_05575 [Verrucomicrobiaceae bacterium 227]